MIKYEVGKNTVRNSAYGIVLRIVNMLGAFIVRTVLIYKLGIEFVGLDSLFSSILMLLSMAELGFSTAVVYKLYKPLAENDIETVCSLQNYYRKIYRYIGFFVIAVGLLLVPLLPKIVDVNQLPKSVNLYLLYIVYLTNTALGYLLFAHKTALLNALQRNDLFSKVSSLITVCKYVIQCLVLIAFSSYYLYLIVIPLTTILTNIGVAITANKHYPQFQCRGEISKADQSEIFRKIKALLYNKIGVAIINGSTNIIISKYLGLTLLGIYSSYYYIFTILHNFFDVFHTAITAGIGNRIITESKEENYRFFNNLFFINAWATGVIATCLVCLYRPFMILWIGEGKTMPAWFSVVMAMYFYFWMIRFIVLIYKNAQGLWWEDRFRPFVEGMVNIVLGIVAVQYWGLYGVVVTAVLTMAIISLPWETRTLFKYYFNKSPHEYYIDIIRYLLVTIIAAYITFKLCSFFTESNTVAMFIVKTVICLLIPNLIFGLSFRKNKSFDFARTYIIKILSKH